MRRKDVFIANVVVPSDIDRDQYVSYALRTQTVCVQHENGDFIKDCPISVSFCGFNDGWFNAMDFPSKPEILGSQVVCLNMRSHDIPIVIGCLVQSNSFGQLEEENQFKMTRVVDDLDDSGNPTNSSFIQIEGRGLKGIINMIVGSDQADGAQINLETNSKGEVGIIRLATNFFNIYASKQVQLVTNELLEFLVRNLPADPNFTTIKYERGVGFLYEDEFGNKIERDATDMRFNGGGNEGIPIVQKVFDAIKRLEDKFNSHVTKFNAHTHITTATVSATPTPGVIAPTLSTDTPITPPTQKTDLENPDVKH